MQKIFLRQWGNCFASISFAHQRALTMSWSPYIMVGDLYLKRVLDDEDFCQTVLNQYFYPAAEAEAAAKSRAMQWLLRRPVWKALLSQFDCLHELWSHPRRDSGPGQRRRPLEVHHRASQQRQGQRNSSRVVSLSGYNVMIQSFVVCSMYGTCVHTKKMYYNNGHFDWITA